jgi:hypothetical protein
MAGQDSGRYWDPLVMQQELSPDEKKLRDNFVTEYLKDYDAWAAAVRVGYLRTVASDYAALLMQEPYVQREIDRRRVAPSEDPKATRKIKENRLESLLWELALLKGPDASHGARVQAARALQNMYEMEGATKIKSEVTHKGGVMMVPAIANVDEWEKLATASQDTLIQSSAEDRAVKTLN